MKHEELKQLIREEIKNVLSEANIRSDIEDLLNDLKTKKLIKSGDIDGNSFGAQGKFKLTVYPVVDTSKSINEFKKELSNFFKYIGMTDTGKSVYQFKNNLYGWIINKEGSSVDIIFMRKSPIKP